MNPIFEHNWYNRNKETYVYGSPISVTDTYTKFLYSEAEMNDLLSNYSKLADELKSIINIKFGKTINFIISDTEEDSFTDGRSITISTKNIKLTGYDKLDLIFGIAFHEVAHILYTDFIYLRSKNICCNPLLQQIHNVLEDEEIENRLTKYNPGYGRYFGKTKHYLLGENGAGVKVIKAKKVNDLDEILTILFCIIRYPKYLNLIDKDILDKHNDLFIRINDILINHECPAAVPFASCSMYEDEYYDKLAISYQTSGAAFDIYRYLMEYMVNFDEQKKQCEEDPESFMNSGDELKLPKSMNELGSEEIDKLLVRHDDMDSSCDFGHGGFEKGLRVISPNPTKYNKLLDDIRPYIKLVENSIITNDKKDVLAIRHFRRNGTLDTNRLADAMQNINTVYNQRFMSKKDVNESKFAFVMIIDESGSMKTHDRRDDFATKIAILFYEVFNKYPGIELYVYGHGDRINAYINKEKRNKYVLGNREHQAGQDDALAYKTIIEDVKRQTSLPIVTLNITDAYFCTSQTDLTRVIDDFKTSNVSFNMLNIGASNSKKHKRFTQRVMDGMVVECQDIISKEKVKDVISCLAMLIKNNYNKYNKK